METERLNLVSPSMELHPQILKALRESRDELGEFLPWVPFSLTEEESIENTKQAISNFEKFEGELRYSLMDKNSGKLVGVIGLVIRDKEVPYFEIGYWLRSSFVGFGYMSEAVRALEIYAFTELHAHRVEIRTAEENLKSRAVAERCGYFHEATLCNTRRLPSGELTSTLVYVKTDLE